MSVFGDNPFTDLDEAIRRGRPSSKTAVTVVDLRGKQKKHVAKNNNELQQLIKKFEGQKSSGIIKSFSYAEPDTENFTMQMRKVVNLRGQYKVHFNDGKSTKLTTNQGMAYLNKHDSLKPAGKEEMQAKASASEKEFKAAISEERQDYFSEATKEYNFLVVADGLPTFIMKAPSASQVKQKLRKVIKKPDIIQTITRMTVADLRKRFQDLAKKAAKGDAKQEEYSDEIDGMEEGLNEISISTKDSYLRKAQASHSHAKNIGRDAGSRGDTKTQKAAHTTMKKRNQGMERAFREDEDLDEAGWTNRKDPIPAGKELAKLVKKKPYRPLKEKDLEESRMKELHGYMGDGKSADWIARKMKLDVNTIKALINEDDYIEMPLVDIVFENAPDLLHDPLYEAKAPYKWEKINIAMTNLDWTTRTITSVLLQINKTAEKAVAKKKPITWDQLNIALLSANIAPPKIAKLLTKLGSIKEEAELVTEALNASQKRARLHGKIKVGSSQPNRKLSTHGGAGKTDPDAQTADRTGPGFKYKKEDHEIDHGDACECEICEKGRSVNEGWNIDKGAKVGKEVKGKMVYGKVIGTEKVMGKPGVEIMWSSGQRGRFAMDSLNSLSMDKKADYIIQEETKDKDKKDDKKPEDKKDDKMSDDKMSDDEKGETRKAGDDMEPGDSLETPQDQYKDKDASPDTNLTVRRPNIEPKRMKSDIMRRAEKQSADRAAGDGEYFKKNRGSITGKTDDMDLDIDGKSETGKGKSVDKKKDDKKPVKEMVEFLENELHEAYYGTDKTINTGSPKAGGPKKFTTKAAKDIAPTKPKAKKGFLNYFRKEDIEHSIMELDINMCAEVYRAISEAGMSKDQFKGHFQKAANPQHGKKLSGKGMKALQKLAKHGYKSKFGEDLELDALAEIFGSTPSAKAAQADPAAKRARDAEFKAEIQRHQAELQAKKAERKAEFKKEIEKGPSK